MILCCGEALIDMIPEPCASGREGFVPHPGGAVFNTAIALGRLGARSGLITGLSTDMFGQQLATALRASRVDTTYAIRSERPTTLAFVQLTDGHAAYSFFDENSAGRMLTPQDMPDLSGEITALFFGGISLACEPGAEAYADLLERGHAGRVVMIDPNIRPGFIRDIGRYRARMEQMFRRADIVKVSDEDLDWLVPASLSLREKAETLLGAGVGLVILTRGSAGATGMLSGGVEVEIPAERVEIADTVGAGDTFNAGVLAKLSELGLLRKDSIGKLPMPALKAALAHGAKVAAITVSRAGANPPWADEL